MAIPPRSSPPSPRLVDGSCGSARRPSQRLTRALRRQTARIAQVQSQSVRSLALGVGEICRHSDHGFRDGYSEKTLGVTLELAKNKCGNLGRSKSLLAEMYAHDLAILKITRESKREQLQLFLNVVDAATHEPFNRIDRAVGSFN